VPAALKSLSLPTKNKRNCKKNYEKLQRNQNVVMMRNENHNYYKQKLLVT
jgi:hypothetical protein